MNLVKGCEKSRKMEKGGEKWRKGVKNGLGPSFENLFQKAEPEIDITH
jgi:hypothetical protein